MYLVGVHEGSKRPRKAPRRLQKDAPGRLQKAQKAPKGPKGRAKGLQKDVPEGSNLWTMNAVKERYATYCPYYRHRNTLKNDIPHERTNAPYHCVARTVKNGDTILASLQRLRRLRKG